MSRLFHAWRAMTPERRVAALAAIALLITMFFPWYGLQSLNRKSGVIYSHNISAFGDVSFVEAAIFLVAAGVLAMLLARAEGRDFQLPGGDGSVVAAAGAWAGLLIFYRVFSRPAGGGYPVGIEWGFFLAFVAAGGLAFSGLRMRVSERPASPRRRPRRTAPPGGGGGEAMQANPEEVTIATTVRDTAGKPRTPPLSQATPVPAENRPPRPRPPYPPAPARTPASAPGAVPEQLSFEDPPTRPQ